MKYLWATTVLLIMTACRGVSGGGNICDTLYHPRYARGFELLKSGESAVLVIKDPWQGAEGIDMRIFLSENGQCAPEGFTGTVVEAPLHRVVCMSTSHVAFLSALGQTDIIKGVSGGRYIYDPKIRHAIAQGSVKDVGADEAVNYELLASLRPDLVLVYGVAGESGVASPKGAELGIRTAYIGDYLETTPLGKAEWLVALGQMVGRREQAVAIFDSICNEYQRICTMAAQVKSRPKVMLNSPWRDVWFVPGDSSYFVSLIRDAGGEYACAGEASRQSRPLSAESAYIHARGADCWLNPGGAQTLNELLAENPRFAAIPSVRKLQVWNNNMRITEGGGSDFWESGAVQPHIILSDLIHILHPEISPGYKPYYYHQLK